jgi:DNA-binding NarL/FixJ family response regulator
MAISQAAPWIGEEMLPHEPIRILVVEDHPIFREGLCTLIAAEIDMLSVGHAANGEEALQKFREHEPDITLMDLRLPGMSGTDALTIIRKQFANARIIVLTTSDSEGDIHSALRAGAAAYILKNMANDEILSIIRSVHRRGRYISPEIAVLAASQIGQEELTPRELEVLGLVRDGSRTKQIADRLSIAETTVSFHIRNIVDKLQANDRTHAVTIAVRRGFVQI